MNNLSFGCLRRLEFFSFLTLWLALLCKCHPHGTTRIGHRIHAPRTPLLLWSFSFVPGIFMCPSWHISFLWPYSSNSSRKTLKVGWFKQLKKDSVCRDMEGGTNKPAGEMCYPVASCFATSRSEISRDREYYQNQSQRSIMEKTASWNITNLGAHVASGDLQWESWRYHKFTSYCLPVPSA